MKKEIYLLIILAIVVVSGCRKSEILFDDKNVNPSLKSASVNNKYIIVLNEDVQLSKSDLQTRKGRISDKANGLLKKYAITGAVEELYETALQGFTAKMNPGQAQKLASDRNVRLVEEDKIVSLSPVTMKGKPAPAPAPETTPWGITRVGGGTSGVGKTAWIIDTGIDLNHPDLNVDVNRSVSFLGSTTTPDDQNGHGTHVAGIIAAKDNEIGVIGVAAGATVVSVRVLDRRGSGFLSGVISGVNYVAANGKAGEVANMSLGGGISPSLDQAVVSASSAVKFALAAGNESDNTNNHSPARVDGTNVYTISAMDNKDAWAYFSNYGANVDYCAPGVSIYSLYKDGGYATLSGTSMAAPHAAGVLLLGSPQASGSVKGDPYAPADPIISH